MIGARGRIEHCVARRYISAGSSFFTPAHSGELRQMAADEQLTFPASLIRVAISLRAAETNPSGPPLPA
jgi:hypothetical protein